MYQVFKLLLILVIAIVTLSCGVDAGMHCAFIYFIVVIQNVHSKKGKKEEKDEDQDLRKKL